MHFADGKTHRLPRRECPFYRECRHALKVLSRLQTGLSDSRPLSSRALYRCLVRGAASDGLIGELGVTEAEGRLLWPWAPRMRCLNNHGGFPHLAGHSECPLGRQEIVFSATGYFARVRRFGGDY